MVPEHRFFKPWNQGFVAVVLSESRIVSSSVPLILTVAGAQWDTVNYPWQLELLGIMDCVQLQLLMILRPSCHELRIAI